MVCVYITQGLWSHIDMVAMPRFQIEHAIHFDQPDRGFRGLIIY